MSRDLHFFFFKRQPPRGKRLMETPAAVIPHQSHQNLGHPHEDKRATFHELIQHQPNSVFQERRRRSSLSSRRCWLRARMMATRTSMAKRSWNNSSACRFASRSPSWARSTMRCVSYST